MHFSKLKLTTVLGAALVGALPLGSAGRADAAPPPGWGYGDLVWNRGQSGRATGTYSAPRSYYSYPLSYGYAPTYYPQTYYPQAAPTVAWAVPAAPWSAPAIGSPGTPATQETVAIRGPDGVVRTFPVQGGAVQQQVALPGQDVQSFVSVTGPDGVVRYYPAASPSTIPGQVIVSPGGPMTAPVWGPHCR